MVVVQICMIVAALAFLYAFYISTVKSIGSQTTNNSIYTFVAVSTSIGYYGLLIFTFYSIAGKSATLVHWIMMIIFFMLIHLIHCARAVYLGELISQIRQTTIQPEQKTGLSSRPKLSKH